jgi:hypothetical protein
MLSVRAYGSTTSPLRVPCDGMGGTGTLPATVVARDGSIGERAGNALPDTIATESGRSSPPNDCNGRGAAPLYKSGRRGGEVGIVAASRCWRCSSCSRAKAWCFLLPLSSVDLVRRRRRPRLERRGRTLPASGIAASFSGEGERPSLGVRGLLVETMFDWIRDCRRSDREGLLEGFCSRRRVASNQAGIWRRNG